MFGFPSVLQSDRGGEWPNTLLDRLTKLLSIKQVFMSSFRLRLNGATEHVHRFLNATIGIYCEHFQEQWEEFLQQEVNSHNLSPISGVSDISPFFLVFGRNAETIALDLPPHPLPQDLYDKRLVSQMKEAFITLYNVCSVHWGVFSTLGDTMSTLGDIMSTSGDGQYIGGIS